MMFIEDPNGIVHWTDDLTYTRCEQLAGAMFWPAQKIRFVEDRAPTCLRCVGGQSTQEDAK